MEITLYSKPNCPYCEKVKRFINGNGITDILFDSTYNVEKVKSFGFMTFPVLEIDGMAMAESEDIMNRLKEVYKL